MMIHRTYYLGKHRVIRFIDQEHQTGFEVIPSYGGIINQLALRTDKEAIDAISGFDTVEDLEQDQGYKSKLLFPFPNRLHNSSYTFNEQQYRFPIVEQENNNALHGFNDEISFKVNALNYSDTNCSIDLNYSYRKGFEYYPFDFDLQVKYSLIEGKSFQVEMKCRNVGKEALPIGLGWHPYFKLNGENIDQLSLKLPSSKRIMVDEAQIPTGDKRNYADFNGFRSLEGYDFDDCFELNQQNGKAEVSLWSETQKQGLSIWQNTGEKGFDFLQVFTPSDRQSIAIEPMSCNIDAFNNQDGLQVLKPSEVLSGVFGVELIDNCNL